MERRAHVRLPARFLVEYQHVEDFLIDYSANISIGGMFIQTQRPLPVGTRFRLRFKIPNRARPVETEGVVCWVIPPDHSGPEKSGMGIKFFELSPSDRKAVEKMLAEWK
jgi:type IV pilus assembly protein PilZ